MQNDVLIDSGPLVALFDKSDRYHDKAMQYIRNFEGRLITSLAVITEVCYLLDFNINAQLDFLSWINDGAVQIADHQPVDLNHIIEFTRKYADLPMDFADSTLVALGERLNIDKVATVDSDFYIYRSSKKKPFTNTFPLLEHY